MSKGALVSLSSLDHHYSCNCAPKPDKHARVRFIAKLACLVCFLVAGMAGSVEVAKAWVSGDIPAHVHTEVYSVRAGDSAWSIAGHDHAYGTGQVRDWIVARYGDVLQPGESIRIPVR